MSLLGRIVETDGIGAPLMWSVCAWCKRDLGAKVCEPAQAGKVSHGICPQCSAKQLASLDDTTAGAVPTSPGTAPRQDTGTAGSAGVMNRLQPDEHAEARPVVSFTFNDGRIA